MSALPEVNEINKDELRKRLAELRSKLDIIDGELGQGKTPPEAVAAVEQAVSTVRSNIWALLAAQHSEDYQQYLGRIRVRRATETCEEVLADLHADTVAPNAPGLEVFQATLHELSTLFERKATDTTVSPEVHDE
jgi:hypothetical protein